jgi:hypothetical protein
VFQVRVHHATDAALPCHSFNIVNGLLIPGGGARLEPFHLFYDTAATLIDWAVEANDNGDYFPVGSFADDFLWSCSAVRYMDAWLNTQAASRSHNACAVQGASRVPFGGAF